jgi:LuxR family maltose regulon positive regulatory protein
MPVVSSALFGRRDLPRVSCTGRFGYVGLGGGRNQGDRSSRDSPEMQPSWNPRLSRRIISDTIAGTGPRHELPGGIAAPPHHGLVSRPALLERLARAASGAVTVVSAPPGSGKTFLLRSWVEQVEGPSRVAWISVERDERDAQRFWLSVFVALRAAAGGDSLFQPPTPSPRFNGAALVERLASDLQRLAERVVLVIDDVHELRSRDALSALESLLNRVPEALHVVLATRRDPQLNLGRLRLIGEMAEIRAADLRFSREEARELLDQAGVAIADASLTVLHERTEGWVAGLRLAAISLADHPEPDRFVAEFSGSERTVADYLVAEMLDRQPAQVRDLLLRTSILERVSGPLADFMTGGSGSEWLLQMLEHDNAFVVSLDVGRSWFRYHHLFADLLRLELRRIDPDRVAGLQRGAAEWHEEHGYVLDAVRHWQAAGEWRQASRLLAGHVLSLVLNGQGDSVHALVGGFPTGAIAGDPELALVLAADELTQGSLDAAGDFAAAAQRNAAAVPEERRTRFEITLANGLISLARRRGDFAGVLQRVEAMRKPEAQAPGDVQAWSDMQAMTLMNLGIAELWSERLDDAEAHLQQGIEFARRIGRPYVEMGCLAHLGAVAYMRSFALARRYNEMAIALAEEHGWGSEPFLAFAFVSLGGIEVWAARLDEGERWLERAVQAVRGGAEPNTALGLHMAMGNLHAGRGEHELALREFRAAMEVDKGFTPPPLLTAPMQMLLLQTQARLNAVASARATFAEMSEEDRERGEGRAGIAAVELADDNPGAAVDALAPVTGGSAPVTHVSSLVHATLLEAIANDRLADAHGAELALERALDLAESDGILLPFVLTQAGYLIERHPRHQTAHAALATEILDVVSGSSPMARGEHPAPHDQLSNAELRVLRYLPSNLSIPEIGAELFLSPNTVGTHIRHIYGKLGVHSRSQAVQRARTLGLLAPSARRH